MSRVAWYAGRLRSMSPAEIGWRAGRAAREQLSSKRPSRYLHASALPKGWSTAFDDFRRAVNRPVLLDRARATAIGEVEPTLVEPLLASARAAAGLRFDFFGYPAVNLPRPIDWNYDPVSRVRWPDLASSAIDHRRAAGDVKWIWELNRLQHLPWLAQAWLLTGDDAFSESALDQLDSWVAQQRPGRGIAWRGAFEVGIRSISVAVALQGLKDSPALTEQRYRDVLTMLVAGAQCCWADRSLFSSANNHLVGELAGAATVAILFPELPAAARWERRAVAALVRQAQRQILPDGSGAEQAVGYQIFTAELMLLVNHLLWLRDGSAPAALSEAVKRSADYLAALVGQGDPAPRYGDDDEGFALRLGPEPVRTVHEHLAVVSAALGDRTLSARGATSLTSQWLSRAGDRAGTDQAGIDRAIEPPAHLFARHGGLVMLRSGRRRLTMDVGPLGYLSIAAHGHADALAVTMASDGVDLIGDPGAGSYYGNPARRQVHRGTRAHATVMVDGVDQSVIGGPFLWTHHARVRVRAVDLEAGIVDAEHDGYSRLDQPVRHRRWLVAPPEQTDVLVVDLLTGPGEHDATVSWPLAPGLVPKQTPNGFVVEQSGGPGLQLCCRATHEVTFDQSRGESANQLGWWTERLERAVPAALLGAHASGPLPMAFATVLRPGTEPEPVDGLVVRMSADRIDVRWRADGSDRQVSLDIVGNTAMDIGPTSSESETRQRNGRGDRRVGESAK